MWSQNNCVYWTEFALVHFPTCQVVKNKREQSKSEAERKPRWEREEEGNEVGQGRVTEVIVENIFQLYSEKKKTLLKFSFNCEYMKWNIFDFKDHKV